MDPRVTHGTSTYVLGRATVMRNGEARDWVLLITGARGGEAPEEKGESTRIIHVDGQRWEQIHRQAEWKEV